MVTLLLSVTLGANKLPTKVPDAILAAVTLPSLIWFVLILVILAMASDSFRYYFSYNIIYRNRRKTVLAVLFLAI